MKRIISLSLGLFLLVLTVFSAATLEPAKAKTAETSEPSLFETRTCKQIIELQPRIAEEIRNNLAAGNTDFAISNQYKVPDKYIQEIYKSILCTYPELFCVDPHILDVTVSHPDDMMVSMRPKYLYPAEEFTQRYKELEKAANYIADGVNPDWTDMQKCRYVHDMIALNCKYYDHSYVTDNYSIYTAYGALVEGEAYCEGYTLAFNYVLSKLGIYAEYIQSLDVNHAWSLVKIGDDYYHVDIAYDDPIPDTAGRVYHDFCLVSDSQMRAYDNDPNNALKHTNWISSLKAANDKFNAQWWRPVETAIFPIDGKEYYIDHYYGPSVYGGLMAHDTQDGTDSLINQITNRWYVKGEINTYWKGNFSYLYYHDGYLYYNDTTNVYKVTPGTTTRELYYNKPNYIPGFLYGFTGKVDGKLYAGIKLTPNDGDNLYEAYFNLNEFPTNPVESSTAPTTATEFTVSTAPTTAPTATTPTTSPEEKPEETVPIITEIKITRYTQTFNVGKTYIILVKDATSETKATYTSSNPDVVKVDSKGKATALQKGTATITVRVTRKGKLSGIVKCKINVKKNPSLSKTSVKVKKNKTVTVKLSGKVSSIKNKYTNTSKAKIISSTSSSTIKVKGLKKGKTTLKIKVNKVKTLKLTVNVI